MEAADDDLGAGGGALSVQGRVGELDIGITVLGVPVAPDGQGAVAGISCAIASGLCTPEEFLESRLPLLQRAAHTLAGQIARSPALRRSLTPTDPRA